MDNQKIINLVLKNEDDVLRMLYKQHRRCFVNWAIDRYSLSVEDAQDLFQDIMVVIVNKIQSGKLVKIHTSFRSYIFEIGRRLIQNKLRVQYNRSYRQVRYYCNVPIFDENYIEDLKYQIVSNEVESMSEPCRSIMYQYYYQGSSLGEIALSLGYKSSKSVKVQKYRCVKTLKEKIFNNKVRKL